MKKTTKLTSSFLAVLSLAVIVSASAFGQAVRVEQATAPTKLAKLQIKQLIATAKTPQDQQRIAEYYEVQAQLYLNESRNDASKIAAYKRSPYAGSCLMCVSTSYSLEAAIRTLRMSKQIAEDQAIKMHELAARHAKMASAATVPEIRLGM